MLMYAGLLLPLGLWAGWTMRSDKNAMILTLWLAINWALSAVHIFDGLTGVTMLSMLSYALYSMSIRIPHSACCISRNASPNSMGEFHQMEEGR